MQLILNGEVLDVQTILDLDDAVDPITSGRIATPLKSSTAQFQYTFREWNRGFTAVTGEEFSFDTTVIKTTIYQN